MPKSQKQKKAKAADFTKTRLKVGKGKQVASNATNTNYSSKGAIPPGGVRVPPTDNGMHSYRATNSEHRSR